MLLGRWPEKVLRNVLRKVIKLLADGVVLSLKLLGHFFGHHLNDLAILGNELLALALNYLDLLFLLESKLLLSWLYHTQVGDLLD